MDEQTETRLREALSLMERGADIVRNMLADSPRPSRGPDWPMAVPTPMIVRPGQEGAARIRAAQILEPVTERLHGATVLDFGCGEGWVAAYAAATATHSTGYDSVASPFWDRHRHNNLRFTDSMVSGQYDVVVCYDVLDHAEEKPDVLMNRLFGLTKPGGVLLLGLHPWTSRSGGHQYEDGDNNLAYWHLWASEEQLAASGLVIPPYRVTRPRATYESLVRQSGFSVLDMRVDTAEPEDFFSGETMDRIVTNTWAGAMEHTQARKIMSINAVHYLLVR